MYFLGVFWILCGDDSSFRCDSCFIQRTSKRQSDDDTEDAFNDTVTSRKLESLEEWVSHWTLLLVCQHTIWVHPSVCSVQVSLFRRFLLKWFCKNSAAVWFLFVLLIDHLIYLPGKPSDDGSECLFKHWWDLSWYWTLKDESSIDIWIWNDRLISQMNICELMKTPDVEQCVR